MEDAFEEKRERLREILKDFDTVMLVTSTIDGQLRSRPMSVAAWRDDGMLYFATSIDSAKVEEIARQPRVGVVAQGRNQYVSISGTARLIRERTLIENLWQEDWRVWFPQGKDDPALTIIAVDPSEAEYWDNSGASGIKYLFEAAKAYATGTTPDLGAEHYGKVKL